MWPIPTILLIIGGALLLLTVLLILYYIFRSPPKLQEKELVKNSAEFSLLQSYRLQLLIASQIKQIGNGNFDQLELQFKEMVREKITYLLTKVTDQNVLDYGNCLLKTKGVEMECNKIIMNQESKKCKEILEKYSKILDMKTIYKDQVINKLNTLINLWEELPHAMKPFCIRFRQINNIAMLESPT
jgi:hypothetical protein